MFNVNTLIEQAKKVTLTSNVKFTDRYWDNPYNACYYMNEDEMTRATFLCAYCAVTEFLEGPEIVIHVDDKTLQLYFSDREETCDFVDVETGEVMLTLGLDCWPEYKTPWSEEKYELKEV